MKVSLLKTPGRIGAPQILGESTREVLAELGYNSDQVEDLRASNLIAWRER